MSQESIAQKPPGDKWKLWPIEISKEYRLTDLEKQQTAFLENATSQDNKAYCNGFDFFIVNNERITEIIRRCSTLTDWKWELRLQTGLNELHCIFANNFKRASEIALEWQKNGAVNSE
jgi:hypothetical protein